MVAHNTGSTVTCSVIKLAYYNLKLYELEIYDLIVAKVALKVYLLRAELQHNDQPRDGERRPPLYFRILRQIYGAGE